VQGFTTANFDMIRQYRPLMNVVHVHAEIWFTATICRTSRNHVSASGCDDQEGIKTGGAELRRNEGKCHRNDPYRYRYKPGLFTLAALAIVFVSYN